MVPMSLRTLVVLALTGAGLLVADIAIAQGDCRAAANDAAHGRPNVEYRYVGDADDFDTPEVLRAAWSAQAPLDTIYYYFPTRDLAKRFARARGLDDSKVKSREIADRSCELYFVQFDDTDIADRSRARGPRERVRVENTDEIKAHLDESDPENILDQYNEVDKDATFAAGHSAEIVSETLQILGQIVVDRASQHAYSIIRERLLSLLSCSDHHAYLPSTCRTIETLRIADVAAAPNTLFTAVADDGIKLLVEQLEKRPNGGGEEIELVALMISSVVAPIVLESDGATSLRGLHVIGEALHRYAVKRLDDSGGDAFTDVFDSPRKQALALGSLAFMKCRTLYELRNRTGRAMELTDCQINDFVHEIAKAAKVDSPRVRLVAATIGSELVGLSALSNDISRARAARALASTFDLMCTALPNGNSLEYGCPSLSNVDDLADSRQLVGLTKAFATGALRRDGGRIIQSSERLIALTYAKNCDKRNGEKKEEAAKDCAQMGRSYQRGLRMASGLLQYAGTYTSAGQSVTGSSDPDKAAELMHEQRKQVLESLTEDVTNRRGREGEWIFSVGGALRAVAGARLGEGNTSFYGPVDLPIGFGVDYLATSSNQGFHASLGIFNLGNYLAFDKGYDVESPDPADALAPTATFGWGFGQQMPVVLGLTGGFTPTTKVEDESQRWFLGTTLGIYVPLWDLN
jgi:hypothetical protein